MRLPVHARHQTTHDMRSVLIYIRTRLKQMPFMLFVFTGLCVFMPILALAFYIRGEIGLPKALLNAIGGVVYACGSLQAAWWLRPLVMLHWVGALIWAVFQHHATYSFSDYSGWMLVIGFMAWILYFRRDVRDYFAGAGKTVA